MVQLSKGSQRLFDIATTFLSGVVTFALGIFILTATPNDYYRFIYLTASILTFIGFFHIWKGWRKKSERKDHFFRAIVEIILGIFIVSFPNLPLNMLSLIVAIYLLLSSLIYLINYFILKQQHTRDKSLALSIISLIAGCFFMISFIYDWDASVYLIAGYFMIWGGSMMLNALTDLFFKNANNPKIRVCLPAIIDCFIPNMWLNRVNRYYRDQPNEPLAEGWINQSHDFEIFIHASHNGFNTLGHADFMFDGTLYSYGNYDGKSEKFFSMIGDGVLFKTKDRDAYIRFCLKRCHKTLFVFGLKLSEEQKESVREQLHHLDETIIPWDPEFIHHPLKKNSPSIDLHVHQIYNEAKGILYKFKSGSFKTYYVFGNNCVRFVDDIIGKNVDIVKMVGIITPGTYLDYLEGEFKRASSNVVSKEIYSIHNYDIGEDDDNDPYKDFE